MSEFDRPSLISCMPPIVAMECRGTEERRGESFINQAEAALIRDLVVWIKKQITGTAEERTSVGSAGGGATSVVGGATSVGGGATSVGGGASSVGGGATTKNISIGVICLYKAQESSASWFVLLY